MAAFRAGLTTVPLVWDEENLAEPMVRILKLDKEKKNLLPLDMEPNENGLVRRIKHQTIPKNRAFVNQAYPFQFHEEAGGGNRCATV